MFETAFIGRRITPSMLQRPVCVSTSTPMTPSHRLMSQRLANRQRIILGWQVEIYACLVLSRVFVFVFDFFFF